MKAISLRKWKANRRNAAKSTGPRTKAGKKKSRWNALKHGMTAKVVVIPGVESTKKFKRRLKNYVSYYKPKGAPEKSYVQELAMLDQRAVRGCRVERNEFAYAANLAKETSGDDDDFFVSRRKARKRDLLVFPDSDVMALLPRYELSIVQRRR